MRHFGFELNVRFSGVPIFLLLLFNFSYLQVKAFISPGNPTCTNPTEIGGFVFEDLNANGIKDVGESFLENITVSLFEDQSTTPVTLNSNINGEYLFTGLVAGDNYRIEFTIPEGMQEARTGTDSRSATQFTTTGTCNNNLGLGQVECYCEDDPFIIVPCYVEGPYDGTYTAEAAVAKLLVSADGHDFIGTTKTADYEASLIASHGQVGSVYGIAWQNTHERYYVAAFHKRYVGFGPNGPDAIYQMDMSGNITGVIELDNLLGSANTTGTDVHDFNPAANGHVYDLGVGDSSFDGVGKIGFGDLTFSADKNTLYAINLFDKKIYAFDVTDGITANASIVTSWDAPDATSAGRHRPFGLAYHDNKLWVGTVDENASNAYVHSLETTGTNFNLELTIPLDYSRQAFIGSNAESSEVSSEWRPWATNSNITYMDRSNREIGFPQPILSDMTFTAEGDMILGFRDRFGDQTGGEKYFKITDTNLTWGTSAGDILKACYDAGSDDFTLETGNSGSCAGVGGLEGSGPGSDSTEFYHWDIYNFNNTWDPNSPTGAFHWETTQGALLQLKAKPYVITSCMDPFNDFSGGIVKFDNSDGGRHGVGTNASTLGNLTGGYTLYETGDWGGTPPASNGTLSKGNGLGALDAACTALPLEIGNYVWYDADGDGIQDASEKGIPGISVTLKDENDVAISTITTDANGMYLFTDANVTGGIDYNTNYKIEIALISVQAFNSEIDNTTLVNTGNGKNDNHATVIGDFATVEITTGSSGQITLDVDFGFAPTATIGNTVWLDENANGIFDAGEEGIPNVTVLLRASDNSIVGTTTTDLNGGYIFNNLPVDSYTVEVSAGLPTGLLSTFNEDTGTLLPDNTTSVNIAGADEHLSAIFGYNYVSTLDVNNPNGTTTGAIGNRVWNDGNGDGIQDAGEAGVPNVMVTLYNDHDLDGVYDNAVSTTTTDASGFYIFDNIDPNAYVLEIDDSTLPANLATTPTGDPDKDADNISEPMIVAPGDVVLLGDFGYQPTSGSTISDVVFIDANADGIQDTDEPGIPGVTIQLTNIAGEVIATMITDENGNYIFGGLPADTYSVKVTDTRNVLNTLVPVSDADGNNDLVSTVTVDGTTDNTLQDFGFAPTAHLPAQGIIGNTIFIDTNNDGAITPGEGAEKVSVNLFEADGTTLVATTQTNKNGTYYFGALDPLATYVVAVDVATLPGGNIYFNSVDPDGAAPGTSVSTSDLATKGGLDFTKDFGYTANTPYAINGTIWEDNDANGTLDASEADRFANTTVALANDAGAILATTTTDAMGNYSFQNLPDGTYTVIVSDVQESLTGFWHSLGADSESDPVEVIINGANQTDIDFGYYNQGAAVGNRVWNDLNANGLQEVGENGIANVMVTMTIDYDGDNTADITVVTTTDVQGFYSFNQLLLDENYDAATNPAYTISVATPSGMGATTLNAGSNDRLDSSDPSGVTVTPNKGENEVTAAADPAIESAIASYDFGFAPTSTIGNTVWLDENANGIFDAGEEGIPNVTVLLRASDNSILGTTITGLNGGYIFNDVPADNYTVEVSAGLPTGLLPTFNEDTGIVTPDNTTDVLIPVGANEHLSAIFGYNYVSTINVNNPNGMTTGAIGNRVWNDVNGDGIQDAGEAGIPNVTVTLYNDHDLDGVYDNAVGTTTTDASGFYIFDNIDPNAYVLEVDDSTLPANLSTTPTGDPDKNADSISEPMMVAPGDVVLLGDFGYQPTSGSTISDVVFIDANADGIQNVDEPGIPGVTMQLTNNAGQVIATTTTNENGNYIFGGLPADTYSVKVTDTRNILNSLEPVSDADGNNDFVSTLTVGANENNVLQDFGFAPNQHLPNQGIIGNTIFIDTNNDSAITPGEGAEKVLVNLFEADGTTLVATTQTNKNGTYYFGSLDPVATYVVAVDVSSLPGGNIYFNSVDPDGAAPGTSMSTSDLATNGGLDFTKDFGYAANTPHAIDGTVWEDKNADGTLDGSEADRFANTTVTLTNNAGDILATTTTDAMGNYSFQNLPDGNYMVIVSDVQESLTGFWHSLGTDSESDPVAVVINGTDQTDIDFGYYNQGAAVGNRVWNDTNANGLQDVGETGIANVIVTMMVDYDGDDLDDITVITTTDAQGFYSFGQLLLDENYSGATAPDYTISAATPSGMEVTTLNAGSNDRLDSNDPSGTIVTPNKGEADVTTLASPASELAVAGYDFGFKTTVLPVELTSFTGTISDCKVTLKWSAASEINFSHYEIQRSEDGRTFTKIGKMMSNGSTTATGYIFIDTKANDENYYRLKMVDLDETFEYSDMINLELDCKKANTIKVYPNPLADEQLTVELYTESLNTRLVIRDITGRMMQSYVIDTDFGQNTLRIDTGDLPNGTYFIYESTNPTESPVKFIKIK